MGQMSEENVQASFLNWMNEVGVKKYWFEGQEKLRKVLPNTDHFAGVSLLDMFPKNSLLRRLDASLLIAYQQYIDREMSWSDAEEKWLRSLQRPVTFGPRKINKLINIHGLNYYEYLIWAKRDDLKQKFPFPFSHPHHDLFSKWLLEEGGQQEKLPEFMLHKPSSASIYSALRVLRYLSRGVENKWSHNAGPHRIASGLKSLKVCVHGYLLAEMGLGEAARAYVRALKCLDIDLSLINVSLFNPGKQQNLTLLKDLDPVIPQQAHVHLFIMNPPEFERYWQLIKDHASFRRPHIKIGQIAWELANLPAGWNSIIAEFDQIWLFSDFVAKAVSTHYRKPIHVVPLSTQKPFNARDAAPLFAEQESKWTQTEITVPHVEIPSPFRFLTLLDGFSTLQRKNPMVVMNAFAKAFANDQRAILVVKITNSQHLSAEWELLRQLAQQSPHIFLINETLEHDKNVKLIEGAHCLVSAHRAEGYGLTLQEAMCAGVPVMATGWSGNLQFMNHENSELLPYHLQELEQDYGPYQKGQQWAEVSADVLADRMLDMVTRYHFFKTRAELVKHQIREKYQAQQIAVQIEQILSSL